MKRRRFLSHLAAVASATLTGNLTESGAQTRRRTRIAIDRTQFFINGQPTYKGRVCRGNRIEGLLMNARLVQGIFDDLNPDTLNRWAYPDTRHGIQSGTRANSLQRWPSGGVMACWVSRSISRAAARKVTQRISRGITQHSSLTVPCAPIISIDLRESSIGQTSLEWWRSSVISTLDRTSV